MSYAQAQTVRTWTGAEGDNLFTNNDNWDPSGGWATGDVIRFDGTVGAGAALDLSTGPMNGQVQLDFTDAQVGAVTLSMVEAGGSNFALGSSNNSVAISIAADAGKVTFEGLDETKELLLIMGSGASNTVIIDNSGTLEFGEYTRMIRRVVLYGGGETRILGEVNASVRLLEESQLMLGGTWTTNTGLDIDSGQVDFTSTEAIGGTATNVTNWSAIRLGNNVADHGVLRYVGTANAQVNRRVRIGNGDFGGNQVGSGTIQNDSSTGKLVFGNASFSDAIAVTLAARTLTLGGSNTMDNEITGVIADNDSSVGGTISVIKADEGKWVLSGENTYTGATFVEQGTLAIGANGSINHSAKVIVSTGATFDVSALGGGFILESGQSIGGDGIVVGDLNFDSGARLIFDTAATLMVTGDVSFDDSFGIASLLSADGSEVDWDLIAIGTYTLLSNNGNFDNISNFGAENAFDIGEGRSAYFQNGSLELVVVPEPSTYALVGGVLALGCAFTLRRRI
ncbi:autotransporter-associated beta strand repeat-containing protein [Coraliomargarita sp. W4R72]